MNRFGLNEIRPAVVTIDMQRGHLDPDVATMPVRAGAEKIVIENTVAFLADARAAGVPVIHMLTEHLSVADIVSNPFWLTRTRDPNATRKNAERHGIKGSAGCELMPQLWDQAYDIVLDTKRRYDSFEATDLEFVLRARHVNMVLFTGINTNSCVLATMARANVLDFAPIVISDCVDSMDGPEAHEAGLLLMRTAFGWQMDRHQARDEILSAGAMK